MKKYLYRKGGPYHLLDKDGETSICGGAKVGEADFEIVEKEKPLLRSICCSNCTQGRVVKQRS